MNTLITAKTEESFNQSLKNHMENGWTSIMGYEVTPIGGNKVLFSAILFKPDPPKEPKREVFNEPKELTGALLEVVIERQNQIVNGRDADYDSKRYPGGQLRAAARLLTNESAPSNAKCPKEFPAHVWRKLVMKSHHKRLIIAASLLCAEADRLAYLAAPKA